MKHEISLLLATRNQGKIQELTRLLAHFPVRLKSLDQAFIVRVKQRRMNPAGEPYSIC